MTNVETDTERVYVWDCHPFVYDDIHIYAARTAASAEQALADINYYCAAEVGGRELVAGKNATLITSQDELDEHCDEIIWLEEELEE